MQAIITLTVVVSSVQPRANVMCCVYWKLIEFVSTNPIIQIKGKSLIGFDRCNADDPIFSH